MQQVLPDPLDLPGQQVQTEVTVQQDLQGLQDQRGRQVPPVPQVATVAMVALVLQDLQGQPLALVRLQPQQDL